MELTLSALEKRIDTFQVEKHEIIQDNPHFLHHCLKRTKFICVPLPCDVLHLPFCQMAPNFLCVCPHIEISSENVPQNLLDAKQQPAAKFH